MELPETNRNGEGGFVSSTEVPRVTPQQGAAFKHSATSPFSPPYQVNALIMNISDRSRLH